MDETNTKLGQMKQKIDELDASIEKNEAAMDSLNKTLKELRDAYDQGYLSIEDYRAKTQELDRQKAELEKQNGSEIDTMKKLSGEYVRNQAEVDALEKNLIMLEHALNAEMITTEQYYDAKEATTRQLRVLRGVTFLYTDSL